MYQQTIGLVGGFGGFATLHFFQRLLETFQTGCERDYPRILMDNNFTMPSRTRALLYDVDIEQITEMIAESMRNLIAAGADKIVLVCGTAHWFLDGVYQLVPEARERVVDMIDITGKKMQQDRIRNCYVLATEGTIKKQFYQKKLAPYGITALSPEEKNWETIRYFIESVKQAKLTDAVKAEFRSFVREELKNCGEKPRVILGCTELPMLVDDEALHEFEFEDPLENVLDYLKVNLY